MQKRNTAIRRIIKCIESEYTTEGEFLLWETSIPKIQKGSEASVQTFKNILNLLKDLRLLKPYTYSRYSKTYEIGFTYPRYTRIWIPCLSAKPYLLKLPAEPKQASTKLRYHLINYQMCLDLFKSGMYAWQGKNLNGPEYPTMRSVIRERLNQLRFNQVRILYLLKNTSAIQFNLNELAHYLPKINPQIPDSLEYFIENKQVTDISGSQKTSRILVKGYLAFNSLNTKIKDELVKIVKNKDIYNNINWISLMGDHTNPLESNLYTNSKGGKTNKSSSNTENQQILDGYWNARKCVFGVYKTLRATKGLTHYSPNFDKALCKGIDVVRSVLSSGVVYPIPPRTLFMALFSFHTHVRKGKTPSRFWLATQQFDDWTELFVTAYDELEQFRQGAEQIGDRESFEGEDKQFEIFKTLFCQKFKKHFDDKGVYEMFGQHLEFYVDWCLFKALYNYRVSKTYFEHRTGIEAPLVFYILAQVTHLRFRANLYPVELDDIYDDAARLRMSSWVKNHDPDAFISSKRREQLNQFFAHQEKMRRSEQA